VVKIVVKVIPCAKKNEITEDLIDLFGKRCLKVKVNQPPEDGKANKAVIEVLAEYFNVKKGQVKIISGETSGNKIINIDGIT